MNDLAKEAAKLQLKICGLGAATLIRDQDGKLHLIPGFDFEVVGVYQDGIKRADLVADLEFVRAKFQGPETGYPANRQSIEITNATDNISGLYKQDAVVKSGIYKFNRNQCNQGVTHK